MRYSITTLCMACFAAGTSVASAQTFGGSPALSQLYVATGESQTAGTEDVTNQSVTSRHHGGTFVRVTTVERGIGNATATMNGARLREIKTVNLCDGNGGRLVPCRNGQSIIGRMRT